MPAAFRVITDFEASDSEKSGPDPEFTDRGVIPDRSRHRPLRSERVHRRRSEGKRWEDKIFRRDERPDDRRAITVWGMQAPRLGRAERYRRHAASRR